MGALADTPHKNEFANLLAEIERGIELGYWPELEAIKLHARARGDHAAGREFRKSLAAITEEAAASLAPKPRRTVLVVRKDASVGAEIIAKAFAMLQRGDLRPDQRGELMLRLSSLADGVAARQATFSKAIPTPRQLADPNVRRRTAAQVAADLEKVEHALKGAAAHSHMKAATDLIDEARRMLASDDMSLSDHAILSLKLGDLREKIDGGQVHDKE